MDYNMPENSRNKSDSFGIPAVKIGDKNNLFYCVAPNSNFIDFDNLSLTIVEWDET
jgi:hypothetical protein